MFGKKKSESEAQEERCKESIRRWRETGNEDEHYPWHGLQRGVGHDEDLFAVVTDEDSRAGLWQKWRRKHNDYS